MVGFLVSPTRNGRIPDHSWSVSPGIIGFQEDSCLEFLIISAKFARNGRIPCESYQEWQNS